VKPEGRDLPGESSAAETGASKQQAPCGACNACGIPHCEISLGRLLVYRQSFTFQPRVYQKAVRGKLR